MKGMKNMKEWKEEKEKWKKLKKWKMKEMHSERRHFVLLCGGAARGNTSLLSAIAGVTVYVYENSRREQAWLQAELENRERAHQENRVRTLRKWQNLKRFALLKLRELNNWEWMIFPDKNFTNVSLQWISWRFKLRNCKIQWTLWVVPSKQKDS